MKYPLITKMLAFVLAVVFLSCFGLSLLGIMVFAELNIYDGGFESWVAEEREEHAYYLSQLVLDQYAAQNLSDVPEAVLKNIGYDAVYLLDEPGQRYQLDKEDWGYAVYNLSGQLLASRKLSGEIGAEYSQILTTYYPQMTDDQMGTAFITENTTYYFSWVSSEQYEVRIYFSPEAMTTYNSNWADYVKVADRWCYPIIALCVLFLALFVTCGAYLCIAVGKKEKDSPAVVTGLNRAPLDLYAGICGFGIFFLVWLLIDILIPSALEYSDAINWGIIALGILDGVLVIILVLAWLLAAVSQSKMGGLYWWHHSVIGWLLGGLWRIIVKCCKFVYQCIRKLFRLLPMIAKRLVIIFGLLFGFFISILFIAGGAEILGIPLLLLLLVGSVALLAYDLYGFGTVMKGAKEMAGGKLHTQLNTQYLLGSYKEHAENLNAMADVATVAAREQMKSDRMKTELITNVSHDIKTPLTSIINYVDLLEKPHTEQEQRQYLEVLSRQSQRMKKLLEDLMEMSKASTGNIQVSLQVLDASETVNQALGEFADKLSLAQLIPVVHMPEQPLSIRADGRITWRVLSNLLSNVVKYALPGTRLYVDIVDLTESAGVVQISLKNISREPLNISAEELTERFVRGDASRNTEGSGLGLNIAQSLMQLQKGNLHLVVDGDLFKVTLSFPAESPR